LESCRGTATLLLTVQEMIRVGARSPDSIPDFGYGQTLSTSIVSDDIHPSLEDSTPFHSTIDPLRQTSLVSRDLVGPPRT